MSALSLKLVWKVSVAGAWGFTIIDSYVHKQSVTLRWVVLGPLWRPGRTQGRPIFDIAKLSFTLAILLLLPLGSRDCLVSCNSRSKTMNSAT